MEVITIKNDQSTTILSKKGGASSHNPLINPYAVELVALNSIGQSWRNLSATIAKNARAAKEEDRERQERVGDLRNSEQMACYLNSQRLHADIYVGTPDPFNNLSSTLI